MNILLALTLLASMDFSHVGVRSGKRVSRHVTGRVVQVGTWKCKPERKWQSIKGLKRVPDGYQTLCQVVAFIQQGRDTIYVTAYCTAGEPWTVTGDSVVCEVDSISGWLKYTEMIKTPSGKLRPERF